MKTFLIVLSFLFVIAFVVFCIMFIHGSIKTKKDNWNFTKGYWIGIFGVLGCALCINVINVVVHFME